MNLLPFQIISFRSAVPILLSLLLAVANALHATDTSGSFRVDGDNSVYYPVFIKDCEWHTGPMSLSIYRADVHQDGEWRGSLMAEIRSHSSNWGHGSDFLNYELHMSDHAGGLLGGVKNTYYTPGVVVWLRGARIYQYSSDHIVEIKQPLAVGGEIVTYDDAQYGAREAFTPRTDLFGAPERAGITVGSNQRIEGKLVVIGNVGLGTSNPTERLSVAGKIRAQEVIVEMSGWSDHVFSGDYQMQPIEQVEQYIKQENHLPGVPSAKDVAEKGVSVGEMQAILLAKIEELTLHLINQKKQLEEQRVQLAEQKAEIAEFWSRECGK